MKKLFLFIPLFLCFFIVKSQSLSNLPLLKESFFQEKTSQSGQNENVNPVHGNTLEESLDATFDSMFNQTGFVGLSAAMRLPDGSTWARAAGVNVDFPTTYLMPDDPIGMGSITKTFVATLTLMLEQDGLLSIDDPISDYLDPIQNVNPNITIKQLLNHTSGIYNYTDNPRYSDTLDEHILRFFQPEEMFEFINPQNFPPGQGWSYSNTNFLLAGLIIEAAANENFHVLLRNKIINPLNLTNTWLMPQETPPNKDIAHLWFDLSGDGIADDIHLLIPNVDGYFSSAWAAGAIVSTPTDLTVFMKNLFGGNLISATSLVKMQDFISLDPGLGLGYGLGALRIQDPITGKRQWGHNGYILYQSEANYLPDVDLAIAVQTNDANPEANPSAVLSDVQRALIITFCNYTPVSAFTPLNIEKIRIAPNPVESRIFVPTDKGNYRIVDAFGQMVGQGNLQNAQINVAHLAKGLYVLFIEGEEPSVGKFVKL